MYMYTSYTCTCTAVCGLGSRYKTWSKPKTVNDDLRQPWHQHRGIQRCNGIPTGKTVLTRFWWSWWLAFQVYHEKAKRVSRALPMNNNFVMELSKQNTLNRTSVPQKPLGTRALQKAEAKVRSAAGLLIQCTRRPTRTHHPFSFGTALLVVSPKWLPVSYHNKSFISISMTVTVM